MQPNLINLAVNEDNDDGTTAAVDLTFSRFEEFANRSVYIASSHTMASRNQLSLYRTFPKKSGNFAGTAKSAVKFTQDYSVPGVDTETTVVVPGIVEVSFSLPVGITPAYAKALRMRAVTLLLDDDLMVPLHDQLMV